MQSKLHEGLVTRTEVSALLQQLIGSYRASETPQAQRDLLFQLLGVRKTLAVIDPMERFGDFAALQELVVSEIEMAGLLSGYKASLTTPTEKVYLAAIQNCALRGCVIGGPEGEDSVLCLMSELQRDSDHKLMLL